jgi:predicted negative regulator of RcsB-dependent stress response
MKGKTIILIIVIILAIYWGYKNHTEKLEQQNTELSCKWADSTGTVYNKDAKECKECHKCVNKNTKQIISRLKDSCIPDEEEYGGFDKYTDKSFCASF